MGFLDGGEWEVEKVDLRLDELRKGEGIMALGSSGFEFMSVCFNGEVREGDLTLDLLGEIPVGIALVGGEVDVSLCTYCSSEMGKVERFVSISTIDMS